VLDGEMCLAAGRCAEYLLDEPEAALSPQRQLAFLRVLHDLTVRKIAQFVIATHSPMCLHSPVQRFSASMEGKSAGSRTRRRITSRSQGIF
jgi:predicted ATPase